MGDLRRIGARFDNCLQTARHFGTSHWFDLAEGRVAFVVGDDPPLLAALRRVGPDLWFLEQVAGPKNAALPPGARDAILGGLRAAGVRVVRQEPSRALGTLSGYAERPRGRAGGGRGRRRPRGRPGRARGVSGADRERTRFLGRRTGEDGGTVPGLVTVHAAVSHGLRGGVCDRGRPAGHPEVRGGRTARYDAPDRGLGHGEKGGRGTVPRGNDARTAAPDRRA